MFQFIDFTFGKFILGNTFQEFKIWEIMFQYVCYVFGFPGSYWENLKWAYFIDFGKFVKNMFSIRLWIFLGNYQLIFPDLEFYKSVHLWINFRFKMGNHSFLNWDFINLKFVGYCVWKINFVNFCFRKIISRKRFSLFNNLLFFFWVGLMS
jgi:hypothetical protein